MIEMSALNSIYGMNYLISGNFELIALLLAGIVLAFASIHDLKKREVPDMLNYGFFFAAIALRLMHFAITLDWKVLIEGFAGFTVGLAIGALMFYAGQWGGGDSKMIIGIGTLFGIPLTLNGIILFESILISFVLNMFIVGSLFGLVWSMVIAVKNKSQFMKVWKEQLIATQKLRYTGFLLALFILVTGIFFREAFILFVLLAALVASLGYFFVFAKTVERSSMVFMLPPEKVTEGDWIDKEVYHKNKYICGPKDLGISKKQIAMLKRYKITKVPVKIGIPFIPSFFLGLVLTFFTGNVILRIFTGFLG